MQGGQQGSAPGDGTHDALLARHLPVLRYDSRERDFATSVAVWTDTPGNRLERGDGTVLAAAPASAGTASAPASLSLAWLGPERYGDGSAASRDDRISAAGMAGVARARALAGQPEYANRVYGHAAHGGDGRMWLSYWCFYPYNDYTLLGPRLGAGRHEGDWEMVALGLDCGGETPELACYARHRHVDIRRWEQVPRQGERPVIYVARGCHAAYFSPGWHWTGVWLDRADGRGPAPGVTLEVIQDGDPASAWAHWPGRWGGTGPGRGIGRRLGLDASSPHGPGHQRQWRDPSRLLDEAPSPRPQPAAEQCQKSPL